MLIVGNSKSRNTFRLAVRWHWSVSNQRQEAISGFQSVLSTQHLALITPPRIWNCSAASHFSNQKTKWQITWYVCSLLWLCQRRVVTHWWWKQWNDCYKSLYLPLLYPKITNSWLMAFRKHDHLCPKHYTFSFFFSPNLLLQRNGLIHRVNSFILYVPFSHSTVSYCFGSHAGVLVYVPQ